ncbi:hypothetical protein [Arsenicicoccus piscis]|uniref:hypothetical protein n=1 Tax=Arsenicicoccus piscis TaxID=673954 RepID=UPI0024E0D8ED|nr:hypothetical protein [Arsenicicoccus piscis]
MSGSAFTSVVDGRTVIAGIIGGLHEGGCTSWQNYSSPFHLSWVSTLLTRASRRWPADAPTPPPATGAEVDLTAARWPRGGRGAARLTRMTRR